MQYKLSIGESSVVLRLPQTLTSGDPIPVTIGDKTKLVFWDEDLQAFRIQEDPETPLFRVVPLRSFARSKFAEEVESRLTLETAEFPPCYASITMAPYYDGLGDRAKQGNKKTGVFRSPIAGKVVGIIGAQGAPVAKGDPILILEAMKMENKMLAPIAGTLASLRVKVGDSVPVGHVLFEIAGLSQ